MSKYIGDRLHTITVKCIPSTTVLDNEAFQERLEERRGRRNAATGDTVVHSEERKEEDVLFVCDSRKEYAMPGVAQQCFLFCEDEDIWNMTTLPNIAIAKYMEALSAKGAKQTQSRPHLFHFSTDLLTAFVDSKYANYL